MKEFTDMRVWQEAHQLCLLVYKRSKQFPKEEIFGLISQIRRASNSVSFNVAEGFGRWFPKDKARFYHQAHGSLTEVKSQLFLARDLGYLTTDEFNALYEKSSVVHGLLQGLIKSTHKRFESKNF